MADIITLGVGGLIVGSIYLIAKSLGDHTLVINNNHTKIIRLRDDLRKRRRNAFDVKKQLQKAHNAAFQAWLEIKNISDSLYRTLNKAKRRLSDARISRKERENLNRSRQTLAHELEKAVQVKRKAHKRWQKMLVDYLAAKQTLEMLR